MEESTFREMLKELQVKLDKVGVEVRELKNEQVEMKIEQARFKTIFQMAGTGAGILGTGIVSLLIVLLTRR